MSQVMYVTRWTVKQRNAFCARWLAFREDNGLTQQVMAELLGVSVATVNRIEKCKFAPRDATVQSFSELERKYKAAEDRARILDRVPGGQ